MEKKFIYSSQELLEYYQKKGVTEETFPRMGFENTTIQELFTPCMENKTVFYPYCGEFGTAVAKYMWRFHYTPAKHKIACVPRGYECFFPDAKEFIYDYPGPNWENYKGEGWVFSIKDSEPIYVDEKTLKFYRNDKSERVYRFFRWEHPVSKKFRKDIIKYVNETYGTDVVFRTIPIYNNKDPFTRKPIRSFAKIPFKNPNKYAIKVDVVFGNRKLDRDNRSFRKWPEVVKYLQSKGYTVGSIGKSGLTFDGGNVINNYDYSSPNEATIEMLSNAKYYIGTDTGTTHLAMNFTHLKSLLFRMRDATHNWIHPYENENTRIIHEMCKNVKTFNNETILYKNIDEFFV